MSTKYKCRFCAEHREKKNSETESDELKAENERLRKAFIAACKMRDSNGIGPTRYDAIMWWKGADEFDIARAALESE